MCPELMRAEEEHRVPSMRLFWKMARYVVVIYTAVAVMFVFAAVFWAEPPERAFGYDDWRRVPDTVEWAQWVDNQFHRC